MKDVWTGALTKPSEKTEGKHPTQKPEYLLERIVLASTQEGLPLLFTVEIRINYASNITIPKLFHALNLIQPPLCDLQIVLTNINSNKYPLQTHSCDTSCTRTTKRIQNTLPLPEKKPAAEFSVSMLYTFYGNHFVGEEE